MATAVTKEEVYSIAADLQWQNIEPSSNKVRDILKKGSLSTINKYLKTWKDEQNLNSQKNNEKTLSELLEEYSVETIFSYIRSEHIQLQTLIIANLNPKSAKQLLSLFDDPEKQMIIERIKNFGYVTQETVNILKKTLVAELAVFTNVDKHRLGGEKFLNQILN